MCCGEKGNEYIMNVFSPLWLLVHDHSVLPLAHHASHPEIKIIIFKSFCLRRSPDHGTVKVVVVVVVVLGRTTLVFHFLQDTEISIKQHL